MSDILTVKNLRKVYGTGPKTFVAVSSVSFGLKQGEILGLLGPNGAGKSTTISMLLGVTSPTSGSIQYFGNNFATHRQEILQHVTFASTYVKMPWRLTVWENLRVYGYLCGLDGKTFDQRASELLDRFGVGDQKHKTMNNLSAGQITRVMLAKAFIPHPKVVLLDEPTASLDPDIAQEVREFVLMQQRKYGTSILYTSHNMEEVAEVCDRVMFLKKGEIIAVDTPEMLAARVGTARMQLVVKDGLKRTQKVANKLKLPNQIVGREIEIEVDEKHVAKVLSQLADEGVEYTQISIAKPNLEDYFLAVARNEV